MGPNIEEAEASLKNARSKLADMLATAQPGGAGRLNTIDIAGIKDIVGDINEALAYFDHLKKTLTAIRDGLK